jgi:hypothetical protein
MFYFSGPKLCLNLWMRILNQGPAVGKAMQIMEELKAQSSMCPHFVVSDK